MLRVKAQVREIRRRIKAMPKRFPITNVYLRKMKDQVKNLLQEENEKNRKEKEKKRKKNEKKKKDQQKEQLNKLKKWRMKERLPMNQKFIKLVTFSSFDIEDYIEGYYGHIRVVFIYRTKDLEIDQQKRVNIQ
ncbi:hypothetical protein M0813_22720 [Anaeramoeba flamelloides]|uniref:Uncharacterized protein n=1 Tax=Anaeramoeba flamelloides TaxID=1746091 RepID=A0ABQ8YDG1_9EUKA|nr:hypothetical protein M0813_22720 [Anaeramoeba flamelloides]